MNQALAKVGSESSYIVGVDDAISPERLLQQVALIQSVMKSVMKDGEHFGKIPGCGDKPSLLKPGAEKLCFTFRMDPEFDIETVEMGKGHREYRIKCTLFSINGGNRIGSGVGSASTMEGKWRFRTGPVESTGKPVPSEYWGQRKSDPIKAQEVLGGRGFITKKIDDVWMIVRAGERVEHDNPADVYNTVLKMAKKRAMVDAVLTCTAASDIFTQDVEELAENEIIETKSGQGAANPPPAAPQGEPKEAKPSAPTSFDGPKTDEQIIAECIVLANEYAVFHGWIKSNSTKPDIDKVLGDVIQQFSQFPGTDKKTGTEKMLFRRSPEALVTDKGNKWLLSTYGKLKEAVNELRSVG